MRVRPSLSFTSAVQQIILINSFIRALCQVAEIKRAVFRALTRLRAATIKEFDTIARLETQAIDALKWEETFFDR